ncbi:Mov34/MPN/PAD-1 family protein [Lacrimispora sp. 210928-DFI.3.58]|uniref:Mov34/MPN/PAD-1 family protein n=1 Tax=Lacrimispora sp. 210928-DFI.3.58 TaxID=2883214 RepID=UPI001D08C56F|nr:Mov34/MPN/PAD-1 family protein [Lacrimispora sp. 210928-DFI.3.58]MCB7320855.1 Mov34/MPN/PAD-1 family protein [Lacrimispora sp. 210928-DFI.3.58]
MKRNSTTRVILSNKAYCQIRDSVTNAKNDFEVGGVLMGYKIFKHYFVVAVTVPTETAEKSKVSFTLDGDWHTARALELMQTFQRKPSILGIWHSHICDGDTFSEQDRQSNMQLAISFNGVLSMIVMMTMPLQDLSMTAYFISPNGKERLCQVAGD